MTPFEQFALDHARHNHCQGCGGCLLEPHHLVQSYQAWCIACRDRIKANCARTGQPPPWRGGWEFVGRGEDAIREQAEGWLNLPQHLVVRGAGREGGE